MRGLGSIGLAGMAVAVAMAGPGTDHRTTATKPLSVSEAQKRLRQQDKRFIENAGQWDARAKFLAKSRNVDVWLTGDGATYDFHQFTAKGGQRQEVGQVVKMSFVGGSHASVVGVSQQRMRTDYMGVAGRTVSAGSYDSALTRGVYRGVDMVSYFDHGMPRYDLVVAPGASPSQIKLSFSGSNGVLVEKDRVALGTRLGKVFQGKLFAYQKVNGVKKQIPAEFVSAGKDIVALKVGSYDRSRELVIDPLVYGSYFGGDDGMDEVCGVSSDTAGGTYLTGWTRATQFPIVQGPYGFNIGSKAVRNGFLAKLQGDAYSRDYCCFLPSTADTTGNFVGVDPFGNVWIAGTTKATNSPRSLTYALSQSTPTAAGGTFALTYTDATLGTISTGPIAYNATATQVAAAINAVIPNGATFVDNASTVNAGATYSISLRDDLKGTFTVTNNQLVNGLGAAGPVYQIVRSNATKTGVFVIRFAQSATNVLDPTPFTKCLQFGANSTTLAGFGIVPNANPIPGQPVEFVFGGQTSASLGADMPTPFPAGVGSVGYLARFRFDGVNFSRVDSASVYVSGGTTFTASGGLGVTVGGVTVDKEGSAYIAGTVRFSGNSQLSSSSTVFQTSPGVFSGGDLLRNSDLYVRKYDSVGNMVYSCLVGGNNDDRIGGVVNDLTGTPINTGSAVAVDSNLNAYVVGVSTSFDFPRTRGVYGEVFDNSRVVTVTKISPDASQIVYSTNLKTVGHVDPAGIGVDLRGYAFVTGLLSPVGHVAFPDETGTPGDPNEPNGYPNPPSVPVTADALDPTYDWPAPPELPTTEGFLFVLNDTATQDVYSTYIGGFLDEFIYAPYVDRFGDVWTFGSTDSARNYTRVSSSGTVNVRSQSGALPAALISPLAFKSSGDAAGSTPVGGILYGITERFFPSVAPAPLTITIAYNRDGFIIKQRVGQPAVASVTVNPGTAPGGLKTSIAGTVTLTSAAPASGADITLDLNTSTAASFDPTNALGTETITVAPGATTATFVIYTMPVSANTNVQVKATYQGSFKVAQFVVVPWLQQLTLVPTSIVGGNTGTGKVTLSAPAPTGGVAIALLTDTPSIVTFPNGSTVTVPAGQTTTTFSIATSGVDVATFPTITASALGVGKTQTLQVTPANLLNLTFTPPRVAGGTGTVGTLLLDGASGSSFTVNLTGPGAGYTYPSTVTFAAGVSSATFSVSTPYVAANTSKTFTATRNAGLPTQQSVSANLFIDTNAITKFTISPTTVAAGGTATGTVTIAGPAPSGGVTITLSSASPLVTLPATAVIPAGGTTGTFTINANVTSTTGTAAINATYGPTTLTSNLTVQGVTFTLAVSPSSVVGGQSATGQITLAQPAGPAGIVVNLTSGDPSVTVPASVSLTSGQTTTTFPITTAGVSTTTNVTISGASGTATASTSITVRPVGVSRVVVTPNTTPGGKTVVLTVTLEAPATANVTLPVTSSVAGALTSSGATVQILKGQTSGSTSIVTNRVSRIIATTLSVTYNSSTGSAILTITR